MPHSFTNYTWRFVIKEAWEQFSFRRCRSDLSSECGIYSQEEGLDWVSPFFFYLFYNFYPSVGAMVYNWWISKALVCLVCGQLSWQSLTGTLAFATFLLCRRMSLWLSLGATVEDPDHAASVRDDRVNFFASLRGSGVSIDVPKGVYHFFFFFFFASIYFTRMAR